MTARSDTFRNGIEVANTTPLYRIRNILRVGQEYLTDRQKTRFESAFGADQRHIEVEIAWHCAQQLRSVYRQPNPADGKRIAEKVLALFPSCPIPEVARRISRGFREPTNYRLRMLLIGGGLRI